jgi:hypothetical protein
MKKTISADVEPELAEALEVFAAGSGVSLSRLLAAILEEWSRDRGLLPGSVLVRPVLRTKGIPWRDL